MASNFTIGIPVRQMVLDGTGKYVDGYRVPYTMTSNGMDDYVDVPLYNYTPERVRTAVAEAVTNHESVQAI